MEGSHHRDRAVVFNIQRFSLHDGPGIRTTVFLKGCPLRCAWCSNPESQEPTPCLIIRQSRCRACGACVDICPTGAVRIAETEIREIDWGRCDQCLACVDACLYQSMNRCGEYLGVQEIVDEVIRDEAFYSNSGGGVTLSGGEPLMHAGFSTQLLEALKKKGLHTAVDTSGHVPWSSVEAVLPFVDLFLWDIKHLDGDRHESATGVGNDRILKNLEDASHRTAIWLRVPLVAGYNDSTDHIRRLAELANRIGAERISLLPCHEGGRSKCEQIGKPHPAFESRAPSQREMEILKQVVEQEGVPVSIGN